MKLNKYMHQVNHSSTISPIVIQWVPIMCLKLYVIISFFLERGDYLNSTKREPSEKKQVYQSQKSRKLGGGY